MSTEIGYLSPEIKNDIHSIYAGKLWCYVGVTVGGGGPEAGLGIAVANERGYSPVPTYYANYNSYMDAQKAADMLNAERKISEEASSMIVASTIAAQNRAKGEDKEPETPAKGIAVTINLTGQTDSDIEIALDIIKERIVDGYREGYDKGEDRSYSFEVRGEMASEEDTVLELITFADESETRVTDRIAQHLLDSGYILNIGGDYIANKDFSDEAIREAIERLTEDNLGDDE